MGGNAFGIPAQRLSQNQYDVLKGYVFRAFSKLQIPMNTPRHLRSKTEHGDLDVLVGYSGFIPGGDEEWVSTITETSSTILPKSDIIPTPDPLLEGVINKLDLIPTEKIETTLTNLSGSNHGGEIKVFGTGKMVSGKEVDEIRELCGRMRECIGATAWRRRGPEVSFRYPCSFIDHDNESDKSEDKFYQVDVLFVPPENLDFNHMMSSYSSTGLLFGRVLRTLSRSFTVHLTHLIVRHSPFFGLSPVDITLTTSPLEFCEWLGLDYQVWKDAGDSWVEEKDVWLWMTTTSEDSIAGQAIKRLITRSKKQQIEELNAKKNKRAGFADRFFDWLRDESPWALKPDEDSLGNTVEPSTSPTPTPTPPTAQTLSSLDQTLTSTSDIPKSSTPANNTDSRAIVDPEQPKPLDSRVTAALEYWKKQAAYDAVLEERRVLAKVLAERQRERMERREKSLEDQIKYELEVKDW